jgi:hypothetical protein
MIQELDFKQLGYFGNIWIVQNHFKKAGAILGEHEHKFDHVSLLVKGKVRIEVKGHPAKEFTGPTFIIIRKDKAHRITALEDETIIFCLFALPESVAGSEPVYGVQHDPLAAQELFGGVEPGYWEKMRELEEKTVKYED